VNFAAHSLRYALHSGEGGIKEKREGRFSFSFKLRLTFSSPSATLCPRCILLSFSFSLPSTSPPFLPFPFFAPSPVNPLLLPLLLILFCCIALRYGTYHFGSCCGCNSANGSMYDTGVDLSQDYHTYAVEWFPDSMTWYSPLSSLSNSYLCSAILSTPPPHVRHHSRSLPLSVSILAPPSFPYCTPFPSLLCSFPNLFCRYWDDVAYKTITPDSLDSGQPFAFDDSPHYVILNSAVGGNPLSFSLPLPQIITFFLL
jgi:hypothetical protein